MIKTLRIISIVAILLACAFLAVPFIFQKRIDPKADELLKTESAVEKFSKTQDQRAAKKDAQASPLVKQAQAFALFLNPPKPEPTPEEIAAESEIRPELVTPKFTLIGTSVHPTRPELSLALIDEPGKGMYWVKQAAQVGHLTIEQIKSGVIVVNDNGRTSEIVAERPEKISLLRSPLPIVAPAAASQIPIPEQSVPPAPEMEIPMEQIAAELAEIEQQVAAGTLDSNAAAAKTDAVMAKYAAEFEAARSRITSEEAKNIDRLGAQLQAKQDVNTTGVLRRPVQTHPVLSLPKERVEGQRPEQALRVEGAVPQLPKTQQLKPKTETKDSAQKTAPRQRTVRRRGTRPRGGTPRTAPDSNSPTPP